MSLSVDQAKSIFKTAHIRELVGHSKKVHSVAWNCNGRKLASGSVDTTVRIWDVGSGSKDLELKGHTSGVDQLCWDPTNPDRLATASTDKTVRIWDAKTGGVIQTIETAGENINISWSPNGMHIIVGNKEDQLCVIETKHWKIIKKHAFQNEVNEISWNRAGNLFFMTTGTGAVDIVRYPPPNDFRLVKQVQCSTSNCYCIDFSPNSKYFAVGGADALVTLWNASELVCVRTFADLMYPVRTLSFSHDSQLLAAASEDMRIDIYHVESGEHVYSHITNFALNAVAWHPEELLLAYAGDEREVRIFGFKERQ
eukprot:TRINITY_DN6419_c0_g1_i3.p2 TRINITY_DN6419_c0_g1~~TRINITY_DN6419_c0_g1_i3.p2  ORF type:complete len:311 (-),score=53.57 TRINITY_DN6419_c0_g1_i3:802-1734(-)